MKLLSLNEEAPREYYIFMNPGNDFLGKILKHNFGLNHIMSSSGFQYFTIHPQEYINGEVQYLPFIKNDAKNMNPIPSPFVLRAIQNYSLEYNLEIFRSTYYPKFPSRLGAIYAFGDLATCVQVAQKHGWPLQEIKKFKIYDAKPEYIQFMRIVKCNMNIVSYLRGMLWEPLGVDFQNQMFDNYWHCKDAVIFDKETNRTTEVGIIGEYLIDGILELTELSDDDKKLLGELS